MANIAIHNRGSIWAPDDILPPLIYHPRPHGIPVAMLHFRSHHPKLLEIYTFFATHAASALGIPISKPIFLPTQRSLWTVPRGPFAHKKSQENFDRLVHKRAIKAWDADPVVIGRWLNYLEEYQLAGVGLRAVRWEHAPIGFMEGNLKDMHEAMSSFQKLTDRAQIAALGKEVIRQESDVTV
ncbi:ribosomal protein S10 domain-containing protein [Hysterangium stoloniferum]|nr:ribosomal protein S10 domain-containing protein [Hysterangium stoloniferum]